MAEEEESYDGSTRSGGATANSMGEVHKREEATVSGRQQKENRAKYKYPMYNWGFNEFTIAYG